MKSILLLICLLPLIANANQNYDLMKSKEYFYQFKVKYGKNYSNLLEESYRFNVFLKNLQLINEMNQKNQGTQYRINKFGDMSVVEFKKRILMQKRSFQYVEQNNNLTILNESWDWRSKGAVSKVKDQKQFGSCWAFSTAGNIEGQHFLKTKSLISLSVEQILECDSTIDPNNFHADCGIFGGWPYLAMQYVMKSGGLASDEDYPYCISYADDDKKKCWPCSAEGFDKKRCGEGLFPPMCKQLNPCKANIKKIAQISGWKELSSDETILADQLAQMGPVSVGLDAGWLQHYHSGIFNPWFGCSKTDLDHAVLMVGYGSQGSKDYWIIKNSWGEDWGEKGYFKIARGENTCGIATNPVTSFIESINAEIKI